MKRTCRILVCLIAAIMIVSALPFTVFAQDDTQIECGYVTDGLVSWYDASNHGTSDTVWEDLYGENDFTVLSDGTNGFTEDGYRLKDTYVYLPDAVTAALSSQSFTIEVSLGELIAGSGAYNHIIWSHGSTGSNSFTLFLRNKTSRQDAGKTL